MHSNFKGGNREDEILEFDKLSWRDRLFFFYYYFFLIDRQLKKNNILQVFN